MFPARLSFSLPIFLLIVAAFLSCEPEEEKIDRSAGLQLNFSTDTVQFDTVFSGHPEQVRNITKRLVAYNPHDKALNISSIALSGGDASPYQLFINGQPKSFLADQTILGGDSILLLINLTVDPQDKEKPFLVKDAIIFEVNNNRQDIKLIAYGQDAHFLSKGVLTCDQAWSGLKPYVLQDTVWINEGCKLTIQKGTRIYFNNKATLMVEGELKVLGEKGERVLFSNSRLDIKDEIGLWAGIHFLPTSKNNEIHFTDIRNATVGVSVEIMDADTLPDLIIANTKIENLSETGIYAQGADLYVYNTLVDNAVGYVVQNVGGGNYTYEHCTLVNFSTLGFFSRNMVAFFSDTIMQGSETVTNPLKIKLHNNIIWSSGSIFSGSDLEIVAEGADFSIEQGNNLLRSTNEMQAVNSTLIETATDYPEFIGVVQYNYQIDTLSPAIDKGKDLGILIDLEGKERDEHPDIGAYEYVQE